LMMVMGGGMVMGRSLVMVLAGGMLLRLCHGCFLFLLRRLCALEGRHRIASVLRLLLPNGSSVRTCAAAY
jgi:hypothetical protein